MLGNIIPQHEFRTWYEDAYAFNLDAGNNSRTQEATGFLGPVATVIGAGNKPGGQSNMLSVTRRDVAPADNSLPHSVKHYLELKWNHAPTAGENRVFEPQYFSFLDFRHESVRYAQSKPAVMRFWLRASVPFAVIPHISQQSGQGGVNGMLSNAPPGWKLDKTTNENLLIADTANRWTVGLNWALQSVVVPMPHLAGWTLTNSANLSVGLGVLWPALAVCPRLDIALPSFFQGSDPTEDPGLTPDWLAYLHQATRCQWLGESLQGIANSDTEVTFGFQLPGPLHDAPVVRLQTPGFLYERNGAPAGTTEDSAIVTCRVDRMDAMVRICGFTGLTPGDRIRIAQHDVLNVCQD